ncbi:unnamed protein product [Calypogeia fissa]
MFSMQTLWKQKQLLCGSTLSMMLIVMVTEQWIFSMQMRWKHNHSLHFFCIARAEIPWSPVNSRSFI